MRKVPTELSAGAYVLYRASWLTHPPGHPHENVAHVVVGPEAPSARNAFLSVAENVTSLPSSHGFVVMLSALGLLQSHVK